MGAAEKGEGLSLLEVQAAFGRLQPSNCASCPQPACLTCRGRGRFGVDPDSAAFQLRPALSLLSDPPGAPGFR